MTMVPRPPGRRAVLAHQCRSTQEPFTLKRFRQGRSQGVRWNLSGFKPGWIRPVGLSLLHLGGLSLLGLGLGGCMGEMPRPMGGLDRQLEQAGSSSAPALAGRWLALIAGRGGRDQVLLVDVERGLPEPLPGLNRPDAQPLSVAVNRDGNRLAVVRQRDGQTELVLYRRELMALESVAMQPPGVPRRVSLRGDGHELAVEVSRGGLWQIDLIAIP